MSPRDLDNRMMSYLYDELPQSERDAFEQQLRSDEPLRRQVEELRATRLMLRRAEAPPPPPQALFAELLRESRRAAPVPTQASFWERLGALIMRPATATAMLVVVVAVTGVWVVGTRDRTLRRGIQDTDQPALAPELPSKREVAAGRVESMPEAPRPAEPAAATPFTATATAEPAGAAGQPAAAADTTLEAPAPAAAAPAPDDGDGRQVLGKNERLKTYPIRPPAGLDASADRGEDAGLQGLVAGGKTAGSKAAGNGDDLVRQGDERDEPQKMADAPAEPTVDVPRRIMEGQAKAPARELNYGSLTRDNAPPAEPQAVAEKTESERPEVEVLKPEAKKGEPMPALQAQTADGGSPQPSPSSASGGARVRPQEEQPPAAPVTLSQPSQAPRSGLDGKNREIVYRGDPNAPPPADVKTVVVAKPTVQPAAPDATDKLAKEDRKDDTKQDKDEGGAKGEKTGAAGEGEYGRAMDHYKNQRYGQAIKEFERFLQTNQGSGAAPDAQLNLARSLQRENQLKTAVDSYRQHLSRYPRYTYRGAVLVETAELEMRLGDVDAARKHLQEAVSDKSTSAKAKELLSHLDKQLEELARKRAAAKHAADTEKAGDKAAEKSNEKAKAAPPPALEKPTPGKKASVY